jgi:signal transduction histidine kinase
MSWDDLHRMEEEQAALRRVALLVVHGASPAEVLKAVAGELGYVMDADHTLICRFEPDNTMVVVASWGRDHEDRTPPIGSSWSPEPESAGALVARTGRPARMQYDDATAGIGLWARTHGIRSGVGCPIMVEGRLWGVVTNLFQAPGPQPEGIEKRMLEFVELVGAAIANAESHDELAASRARIIAAADATRRRIERDLHDGVQQTLIACDLQLRTARAGIPPGCKELQQQLSLVAGGVERAVEELREISRGLHPTILSRGGIGPALKALARRSAVPVELHVYDGPRLAEPIEVAFYYVVSEALTNTAKHADASLVRVELNVEAATASLSVHDDGVGGAVLGRGSGLIGLKDRIETLGGRIEVVSPIGHGTSLFVEIPTDRVVPTLA